MVEELPGSRRFWLVTDPISWFQPKVGEHHDFFSC